MPVVFRHELAGQRAAAWAQPMLTQEGARLFDHFRVTALHDARRFGGDWQTGVLFQRILQERGSRSVQAMAETKRLALLPNMRVVQLPPHKEFVSFKTIGPTGVSLADINGKAAAIECYLDLKRDDLPESIVRWTSFNRDLGVYHGELQHKTQFMKDFLQMRTPTQAYDKRKIEFALNAWSQNASRSLRES